MIHTILDATNDKIYQKNQFCQIAKGLFLLLFFHRHPSGWECSLGMYEVSSNFATHQGTLRCHRRLCYSFCINDCKSYHEELKICKIAQSFCASISLVKFERIERKFKIHIPGLRQYNEKATRAFMKDLSDGFFPSELQVSAIWLWLKKI